MYKSLENELISSISKSLKTILNEEDRHRPGYYKEYWAKKKAEKEAKKENNQDVSSNQKKVKKDRREYYRKYNMAHPERLERGYTKGYKNGNYSEGPEVKSRNDIYFDELGRARSKDPYNPTLTDLLDAKEKQWHDDDWYEGINDD